MEGLGGPPSDWPFVTSAACRPRSGPGLARRRARVRGYSCRWLGTRPSITGQTRRSPDAAAACRTPPGNDPAGAGPGSLAGGQRPQCLERVTRRQPGKPEPACLGLGISSTWIARGMDLAAGRPRDLAERAPTPECRMAVACHMPIRCRGKPGRAPEGEYQARKPAAFQAARFRYGRWL